MRWEYHLVGWENYLIEWENYLWHCTYAAMDVLGVTEMANNAPFLVGENCLVVVYQLDSSPQLVLRLFLHL